MEHDFNDHTISNLTTLFYLIKKNHIRYLYLSDAPAYSLYYLLLRIFGIKIIVVHDHTPGERTRPRLAVRLIKSILQRIPLYTADHFIAVTDYIYRRLLSVYCIPATKCSIAQNGITPIDLENFDDDYAHNVFNIQPQKYIVVTTGRATYYKGIDFFIHAANKIVNIQGIKQLHFLYCGDGPDMDDFRELVNKFNLGDYFTFAGKRDDIRQILPSCSIGFHAAKGEVGYSLSILEYMSAGLATIVPDLTSTSEASLHNENSLIYKHENIDSACEAITKCISDKLRNRLSKRAINDILDSYNIDKTNSQLLSTLENVFI